MKKITFAILFLFSVTVFTNCSTDNKSSSQPTAQISEMGDYEVSSIDVSKQNIPNELDYPIGINDQPGTKAAKFNGKPVSNKKATWNAAVYALKLSLPLPEETIIFNYAKTERQINNENECLFMGDFEAKNEDGKYIPMFFNIRVTYTGGNAADPSNWKAHASVVK